MISLCVNEYILLIYDNVTTNEKVMFTISFFLPEEPELTKLLFKIILHE